MSIRCQGHIRKRILPQLGEGPITPERELELVAILQEFPDTPDAWAAEDMLLVWYRGRMETWSRRFVRWDRPMADLLDVCKQTASDAFKFHRPRCGYKLETQLKRACLDKLNKLR